MGCGKQRGGLWPWPGWATFGARACPSLPTGSWARLRGSWPASPRDLRNMGEENTNWWKSGKTMMAIFSVLRWQIGYHHRIKSKSFSQSINYKLFPIITEVLILKEVLYLLRRWFFRELWDTVVWLAVAESRAARCRGRLVDMKTIFFKKKFFGSTF